MEIVVRFEDAELEETKRVALALGSAALLKRLGLSVKDVSITKSTETTGNLIRVSTEKEFKDSIFKQVVVGPLLKEMMEKDALDQDHAGGAAAP